MQRQIDLGLVVFRDDTKPPFRKAHLRPLADELLEGNGDPFDDEEVESEALDVGMQVMGSYIYKQSQVAVKYLRALMGGKVFDNPKDHEVLARIIKYCTDSDDLVLDSFAGSGTTGQAVLHANQSDKGARRFILVQQEYDTNEDRKKKLNICEKVTRERVRRAAKKEGLTGSFTYARLGSRLFGEYKVWEKEMPAAEELAKYIFYTDTSREFQPKQWNKKTGRIGDHKGTAYYLLYTGDKEGRSLDTDWLATVGKQEKCKRLVVYCEKIWLHREDREKWEQKTGKLLRAMQLPMGLK